jgi:dTDP-4-amino-4,6-dideoxygalactose transaminase
VVQQHGTDYTAFRNGLVPKYQWLDAGSAFMPSDLTAAFLLAQLERAVQITDERRAIWERYDAAFVPLDHHGVQRPAVPAGARHNGHIYYLLLPKEVERAAFMTAMQESGIETASHYIPLDLTPGGRRFARPAGSLAVCHAAAERLVRLPLWAGMGALQDRVIEAVTAELGRGT